MTDQPPEAAREPETVFLFLCLFVFSKTVGSIVNGE